MKIEDASKILVVRLRSLGDCVLSTPAIHLLKESCPAAEIAVLAEPVWHAVYEGNPDIARILPPSLRAVWRFSPDLVIDFHGGNRAARLTLLSRAKVRAGFAHYKRRAAYNVRIPTAQEILGCDRKVHTAEHMASAMFYLGLPHREIPRARLFAQPKPAARPYAVIHPVAATAEKTWPAGGFLEVAEYLRAQHGLDCVFIGAASQDLSAFRKWRVVSGADLSEIKSLIAGASVFIGNDSGPAHMAAAFGVPPVVIFGPSDAAIWGPWVTRGEIVQAEGPIAGVDPERVIAAVDHLRVPA